MTNDLSALDTALELLRHGHWPVALHPRGETIRTRDGERTATGKEPIVWGWGRDRPTEDELRRLYRKRPAAGVGLALGPGGGVIDVEVDGPEGEESLKRLFGGEPPPTVGWSSRRGPHRLFCWDSRLADVDPRRRAKVTLPELPGLEFRFGQDRQAQSACPPTVGEDGQPRRWNGCQEVAPLPEPVIRFLAEALAEPRPADPRGADGATEGRPVGGAGDTAGSWFRKAMENEAGKVATARDGQRHAALLSAARTLGGYLHHGYLTESEVAGELTHAANRASLPTAEVAQTIHDGLAYGKAEPLPWPEKLERPGSASRNGRNRTPEKPTVGRDEDNDAEPLPEPDWPDPPADEAYHGLPGRVVETFRPHSEADPFGLLVQFLVMFGSLIGRGPRFHVEATPHHVNEFAVLVGRTATGRKGTSAGRIKALLKAADPV